MRLQPNWLVAASFLFAVTTAQADDNAVCKGRKPQVELKRDAQGRIKVGEEVTATFKSAQPTALKQGAASEARLSWTDRITSTGATYISPHFGQFSLAQGDYVVVRSPDGSRSFRYEGLGKTDNGKALREGFWGGHIAGDTAIVELYSVGGGAPSGYTIDRYARGFADLQTAGDTEALCGPDDSQNAKCYQTSDVRAYKHSRAVARLLIGGSSLCTGWLVGNQGHVLTNQHCIGTSSDALNTDFEFNAEGATCATNCMSALGCPGTVVATSSTLISVNAPRDYALVKLPTNPTSTYGYLQLRNAAPVVDERIYIPQHPQGWGKYIARNSTHPTDASGFAEIHSLNQPACQSGGPLDVGYYADTQGGSSGSPVIAYSDQLVVALHHCANCPNRGVPITSVISHLGANLPTCAIRSATCPDPYEVWMADTWSDTGKEPDPATASQDMWGSPYIWVRKQPDGVANPHAHENPEFGQPNYVYAKMHGGPLPGAAGVLRFYWANASTGLSWPTDWTQIGSGVTVNGFTPDTTIQGVTWPVLPGVGHYCLLARWVSSGDPMTFAEGSDVNANTRNNNNIVWRNVNIVDEDESVHLGYHFIVRNVHEQVRALRFMVRVPEAELDRPYITKLGRVFLTLPDKMLERWKAGGGQAEGLKQVKENTFEVISPRGATFFNIPMGYREEYQVGLAFERIEGTQGDGRPYHVEMVQFDEKKPEGESLGGIGYEINPGSRKK